MNYQDILNVAIAAACLYMLFLGLRVWQHASIGAKGLIAVQAVLMLSFGVEHLLCAVHLIEFSEHWYLVSAIAAWICAAYFTSSLPRLIDLFDIGTLLLQHSPSGIGLFRSMIAPDGKADLLWVARSESALYEMGFDPTRSKTWVRSGRATRHQQLWDEYRSSLMTGVPILGREMYWSDLSHEEQWFWLNAIPISSQSLLAIWTNITSLKKAQAELDTQLKTDPLTGVGNRYALNEINLAESHYCGALYIDLDRFKAVNDTLGHDVGDALLCAVVDRLKRSLEENDRIFRLGGDEFLTLVARPSTLKGITAKAESILKELQRPFWVGDREIRIDGSIGVADRAAGTMANLLRAADIAMYAAKESGGTVLAWDHDLLEKQVRRERIQMELHNTRDRYDKEFQLYYQPINDLQTLETIGAEALLRWRSSQLGWVPPGEFIPIAEDTSEISRISRWVIDNAIRQIAGWGQKIPISINVSPWDLEQSEFIANLRHACDRYNVSISKVSLEITERAVASNLKYYESVLAELSSLHVALKIDDFGTGDSSLRRLLDAPWDTVKIDRSLIPLEASDHARTNICRAIVGLCSDLNIQTIAEGIETEEQLRIIRELGVNGGQGFYFAKPVPPEEIKV